MMNDIKKSLGAASVWFPFLLAVTLLEVEAPAQVYRIAATITITNAPTTNGQTLTVNSDTRTWTNTPSLNPAIYIQTNSTVTGSTTNLFQHLATYRFASSINVTYVSTNAIKLQAPIGSALSVTIAGGWATNFYTTQLVSTPFTAPVIVPFATLAATNATNIAGQLVSDLAQYSPSPPITNAYNLGATNLSVMPIWYSKSNSFLTFALLEAGQNMTLSNSGTSIVVSASQPSRGITNLNGLTNLSQWFTVQTNGTDFSITNTPAAGTHATNYFNFPFATNFIHGKLRSNDWTTFTLKQPGSTILTNLSGTGASTNLHPLLYAGPTNNGVGAPLILKGGTGITLSTNNGTNLLISGTAPGMAEFTNQVTRWLIADGSTNFSQIGDKLSTNRGSSFVAADGTHGSAVLFDASTYTNGFSGSLLYAPDWSPVCTARIYDSIADQTNSFWFGLSSLTMDNTFAQTPIGFIAGFRYWNGVDTHYIAYSSDNSSSEANDTGVTPAGGWNLFEIRPTLTGVVFLINGTSVRTNSANIPQSDFPMRVICGEYGAASSAIYCEWVRVKSDR